MPNLSHNAFFDLSEFAHRELFDGTLFVWEVLTQIAPFLSQIPLGIIEGKVDPRAYLVNPETISIGKGSVVEAGAYIKGPCLIGKNCEVRHGAYIRGNLVTGDHCVIGHTTEIKNALFLNGAKAGHFAYIGDTILGNRVNLGAGVKCANLRLDEKNVQVVLQEKKIDSGLRKFGAILGDDVHIGCNAVLNPGTIMGKKSGAYPCLSIRGVILEGQIIKSIEYDVV